MNYTLGADQTDSAGLFLDMISPTDFDLTKKRLTQYVDSYRQSKGFMSTIGWGWNMLIGDPIGDFIKRYVIIARELKQSFNEGTVEMFRENLITRYEYKDSDLQDYIVAFMQLQESGLIPESILKPYSYKPPKSGETAIGSAIDKTTNKILWWGLGAVAVYAFVTVGLPNTVRKRIH